MKHIVILLTVIILSACTGAPPAPTPTLQAQTPTTATATATSLPPDEQFIAALYDRIDIDDTIPPAGKRAIAALYVGRPTYIFEKNEGVVLQFNILDVPSTQQETTQAAVQLIGTAVIVASEHQIHLDGIEVVYFATEDKPYVAFHAIPPWGAEQILMSPLAQELIEALMEKGVPTVTPPPRPTAPLLGG